MLTPRNLSLAAVCFQSTALAIVLHISQSKSHPGQAQYKAASAVLITELGKLFLSFLLALRDTIKERRALHRPRHALPSPELYAIADEIHAKDLYKDDPYDIPTEPILPKGPTTILKHPFNKHRMSIVAESNNLRRRSSVAPVRLQVEMANGGKRFPEASTLQNFQWPASAALPLITDEKGGSLLGSPSEQLDFDLAAWTNRRRMGICVMLWQDCFGSDWWKMSIPAVLFGIQNNLIYVAARNLSVPVFQITFQLKTLITALAAVIMLGRRLSAVQWMSLVILGLGVATMQIGAIKARPASILAHGQSDNATMEMNYVTGISSVLVSCICSAVAATYFELVLKKRPIPDGDNAYRFVGMRENKPASLWVRNIQLSTFSTIFGIFVVLFQTHPGNLHGMSGFSLDLKGLVDPLQHFDHWYDPIFQSAQGFFDGFHTMAWVVILLQTVGGLLIAVAIKHADNVAKGFALSISIVFTFILSVILFDFKMTVASTIGGLAVVGSTLLFEGKNEHFRAHFHSSNDSYSPSKSLLRRWHYRVLVVVLVTFVVSVFPMQRFSVTTAAWEMVNQQMEQVSSLSFPTIGIAEMGSVNAVLIRAAGPEPGMCAWGVGPLRFSTMSAYGPIEPVSTDPDYPYVLTDANQFSLDDILTTRMMTYAKRIPILSSPAPDFIFLPFLGQIYSNPWGCESPTLQEGIRQATAYIREIVASVGPTPYPRIILPLAPIRSSLENSLMTPELMDEFKDSLILVSIESAPKMFKEQMKYTIDVPYPTGFHLLDRSSSGLKVDVGDYFLNQYRPSLLHYAAASSHPWGGPPTDPFNGFALRNALHKQISEYVNSPPENATSTIIFDNITNAIDGQQNLTVFHEHMASSIFCPMPAGDSPTRRALYEAVLLGCIPVIFRERSYGRLLPSNPDINDMSKYTVYIDENDLINGVGDDLITRLERIPDREVTRMQEHIRKIAPRLQWSVPEKEMWFPSASASSQPHFEIPPGALKWNHTESLLKQAGRPQVQDAFGSLIHELQAIKSGNWIPGVAKDTRRGMNAQPFGARRKAQE